MTDQVEGKQPRSIIIRSERLPVSQLTPYYRNARRHADSNLQESLTELGQYRAICVNIGTHTGRPYEVLAGCGTLANTIAIECNAAPDLHAVQGDPVLLEWAIEVLTKNAIDALAGRGGRVSLSADHGGEPDSVVIRVADDGPGIPSEIRSRVFEPGFSTKQSGWGIGLSLAKRIVEENHGGKLALAPSEQGATFEIILH